MVLYRIDFRLKLKRLNWPTRYYFVGNRRDVPDIFKTLDVSLFPTYREGLPLALLEAMASCVPVVASDITVVKEVIDSPDIGRLINLDDPEALAKAM
jgi:glycosyltransferase involved in cell wall biosynthesis